MGPFASHVPLRFFSHFPPETPKSLKLMRVQKRLSDLEMPGSHRLPVRCRAGSHIHFLDVFASYRLGLETKQFAHFGRT
jgi:hypothetical protein